MLIFFDTEFIDDGKTIEMISIGLAREDGATYYAENAECDTSRGCQWVQENVVSKLTGPKKTRDRIRDEIVEFCGTDPQFWAYFSAYDWVVICQLFGRMLDTPAHWPNRVNDSAQIGVRPLISKESVHNALADAIGLRNAMMKLRAVD